MNDTPIRNSPSREITTVPPANRTARPLVSIACDDGVLGIATLVQTFAVPGADEQRVVDADTDADQRCDLRGERRNVQDSREQVDEREPDPDAEQRGHDRHAHRKQRPERDQQDDDGGEDPDRLARRLRLIGEHRAAELYLQARRVRVLGDGAHVRCEVERDVVRLDVEEDLRVRDLAVASDEAASGRLVRDVTLTTCGSLRNFAKTGSISFRTAGELTSPDPRTLEDEFAGVALACKLTFEDAEGTVGLGTGQREGL